MTGADVLAKDMLFATLDPTMRGVELPSGKKVILSDTVGFISELQTQLVAAFRATLEEVLEADLILHVRDIAHPETEEQAADVGDILESLGVDDAVPMFEVWNKIDLLAPPLREALEVQDARKPGVHAVSALTGEGLAGLLAAITDALDEARTETDMTLPFTAGKARAWLHEEGIVLSEDQGEDGYHLHVRWTARQKAAFEGL
jgi:GTP-binding protein HflX